jgi:hypothetical protein
MTWTFTSSGGLGVSVAGPGGQATSYGRFRFVDDRTVDLTFFESSNPLGLPNGRLTVSTLTDQALTLTDEAGQGVAFIRWK